MKKLNLMRSGSAVVTAALLTALLLLGLAGCPDGDPAKKKPDPVKPPVTEPKSDNAKLKGLKLNDQAASIGTGAATAAAATPGSAVIFKKAVVVEPETEEPTAEVDWQVVTDLDDLDEADFFPLDVTPFDGVDEEKLVVKVTAPDKTTVLYYVINVSYVTVSVGSITVGSETLTGASQLPSAYMDYAEAVPTQILFSGAQPSEGFAIAAVATTSDEDVTGIVSWAKATPADIRNGTALTFGTTTPIKFNDMDNLIVKVVDPDKPAAIAFYRVEINLQQSTTIKYGTPNIDLDTIDSKWDDLDELNILKIYLGDGNPGDEYRRSPTTYGVAKVLFDEDGLYVYVVVTDANVSVTAAASQHHQRDSVEIFVNEDYDGTKSGGYANVGGQYRIGANGEVSGDPEAVIAGDSGLLQQQKDAGLVKTKKTSTGYEVMAQIPWRFKGKFPVVDQKLIGLELQINESIGDDTRRCTMVWNNIANSNYQNVSKYAEATLDAKDVALKQDAAVPYFPKAPASGWYNEDDLGELSVEATIADSGTLTYEWFQATSFGAAGTTTGVTAQTLDLSTLTLNAGTTYYFYVTATNNNPSATGSIKTNSADSARARIQIFETGDNVVEQLTLAQNVAIYEFNLPAGATWAEYEDLTVDYKFDAANLAKSIRFNRVYGSYQASDFSPEGNYSHAAFDAYGTPWLIADNGGAWAPLSTTTYPGLAADVWYTMTYKVDGSTANSGFVQTHMPSGDVAYFGIGIAGQQGATIVQLVKNITLVNKTNAANNIVASGSGLPAQAFAGYPQADSLALSSRIYTTEAAGPVTNPVELAPANGTLFSATAGYAENPAGQTFNYKGDEYWIVGDLRNTSGDNQWDKVVIAPFDGDEASIKGDIATAQLGYGGGLLGYTRIGYDFTTLSAAWNTYSKLTLTVDVVPVAGTDVGNASRVQFRVSADGTNADGVDTDGGTSNMVLTAGSNQTLTFNVAQLVNGAISAVKSNDGAFLFRVTKAELSN